MAMAPSRLPPAGRGPGERVAEALREKAGEHDAADEPIRPKICRNSPRNAPQMRRAPRAETEQIESVHADAHVVLDQLPARPARLEVGMFGS